MHLAGMLDDAIIADQDEPRLMRVMAPKINGAWNLHELTKNSELELFVLFSSAASILGSVGQGNYAAANAFLDSLAYYRRSQGLPACSINWGPWESTGLVHRLGDEHKRRIKKQGIGLLSNEEGIALLDDVLEKGIAQPVLLPILKARFNEVQSASPYPPPSIFKDLLEVKKNEPTKKDAGTWAKQLLSLNPKQREQFLIETLQQEIAKILSVPDAKKIHLDKSLQEFGMDSLMAVELRNKLSTLVGKKLPVTLLFDYPNVLALAAYLDGFISQQENGQTKNIDRSKEPGWRDAVYSQLMEELKIAGAGEDANNANAVKAMIDELNRMMGKVINGKHADNTGELDDMSLEELEDEFEKELKNI
jgi:polyketide synthase 12/epothilone polyketide synthase D